MQEPSKGQPDFAGEPTFWTRQDSPRGPVSRSPEASESDAKAGATTDLDRPMTIPEFARWIGVKQCWVRRRLRLLPGVIVESREVVRIHPRTYLDGRLPRLSSTAGGREPVGRR